MHHLHGDQVCRPEWSKDLYCLANHEQGELQSGPRTTEVTDKHHCKSPGNSRPAWSLLPSGFVSLFLVVSEQPQKTDPEIRTLV
jgi:hypothetical protein